MPGGLKLALRRNAPVVCASCGRQAPRRARQQRYCSDRCRQNGSRRARFENQAILIERAADIRAKKLSRIGS